MKYRFLILFITCAFILSPSEGFSQLNFPALKSRFLLKVRGLSFRATISTVGSRKCGAFFGGGGESPSRAGYWDASFPGSYKYSGGQSLSYFLNASRAVFSRIRKSPAKSTTATFVLQLMKQWGLNKDQFAELFFFFGVIENKIPMSHLFKIPDGNGGHLFSPKSVVELLSSNYHEYLRNSETETGRRYREHYRDHLGKRSIPELALRAKVSEQTVRDELVVLGLSATIPFSRKITGNQLLALQQAFRINKNKNVGELAEFLEESLDQKSLGDVIVYFYSEKVDIYQMALALRAHPQALEDYLHFKGVHSKRVKWGRRLTIEGKIQTLEAWISELSDAGKTPAEIAEFLNGELFKSRYEKWSFYLSVAAVFHKLNNSKPFEKDTSSISIEGIGVVKEGSRLVDETVLIFVIKNSDANLQFFLDTLKIKKSQFEGFVRRHPWLQSILRLYVSPSTVVRKRALVTKKGEAGAESSGRSRNNWDWLITKLNKMGTEGAREHILDATIEFMESYYAQTRDLLKEPFHAISVLGKEGVKPDSAVIPYSVAIGEGRYFETSVDFLLSLKSRLKERELLETLPFRLYRQSPGRVGLQEKGGEKLEDQLLNFRIEQQTEIVADFYDYLTKENSQGEVLFYDTTIMENFSSTGRAFGFGYYASGQKYENFSIFDNRYFFMEALKEYSIKRKEEDSNLPVFYLVYQNLKGLSTTTEPAQLMRLGVILREEAYEIFKYFWETEGSMPHYTQFNPKSGPIFTNKEKLLAGEFWSVGGEISWKNYFLEKARFDSEFKNLEAFKEALDSFK